MTTRTERKKTKLRFVGLYSVSLLLIFVLVSAFWQRLAPKNLPAASQESEKEAWFLQMDSALHVKMAAIDNLAQSFVKARQAGAQPDTAAWLAMHQSLGTTLDSIDRQAGYLTDGPKKTMMTSVSANFRKALESRQAVLAGIVALPKATPGPAASGVTTEEMNVLKGMLQEKEEALAALQKQGQTKDETIAALQKQSQAATNSGSAAAGLQAAIVQKDKSIAALQVQLTSLQGQLRQKEAALQAASVSRPADGSQKDKTISALQGQITSLQNQLKQKEADLRTASASRSVASGGGEWQQKYQSLKASFDKVAASEKSVKGAYQTLADDNRRLLSQLQAARKG